MKYLENIRHNILLAQEARLEAVRHLVETEKLLSECDGRKKSVIEALEKRIVQAKQRIGHLEEKIHAMDTLESRADIVEEIDAKISALCAERLSLCGDLLGHSYLKSKSYGMI
jgi:L-lactate utilization protein LutB